MKIVQKLCIGKYRLLYGIYMYKSWGVLNIKSIAINVHFSTFSS